MATKSALGMILKGYPRISETFISNEILLLEALGVPIHIFSMRRPRESFCHASVKQIRARVDYLPHELLRPILPLLYYNVRLALKRPAAYRRALAIAYERFCRTRKTATVKHLLQAGYLVQRFLPGSGVTQFHAHFAHSPTSVAMFASCLSGLPFSFTAHAKDIYTSDPRQLAEKIERARFVVTCTGYNRDYLDRIRSRAPAGKVSVDRRSGRATPLYRVYHGIDLKLFSNSGKLQAARHPPAEVRDRCFHILTVARIIEKKGLPTVYRALRLLLDQGLDVRHTLIGSGDASERTRLGDLVRDLGLSQMARWTGTLPHEAVLAHYRRSDLFVLGCQVAKNGDRDGIPNVLVESMAMGVPVVATQVSAIPELVTDGTTGLLVPPGNPQRLADAMKRLLTDHPLRRRVITAARQRVVEEFDNTVLIQELAAIYQREGVWGRAC